METEIQTSTPQGSPILAYGEAKGPRLPGRGIVIFGFVLVLVVLIAAIIAGLFWSVELPKNTFVLVSFHAGEHLSDPLPRVWQNTATTSKLPFVAGIAKTADGWRPFTITFRGFGNAGSWTHATGPFVIHADQELELEQDFRAHMIGRPIYALKSHTAFVTVKGDALDASLTGSLNGVVDGNIWKTTMPLTQHAMHELASGDLAIDLVAFPESWPMIKEVLKGNGIELDQMPETIAWTPATGTLPTLTLDFGTASPSTSTILGVAAAAGEFDTVQIQLPDGTVADDLRLPMHLLTSTSTTDWKTTTDTLVHIDTNSISISHLEEPSPQPLACPGRTLARLRGSALRAVIERTDPTLTGITSLEVAEDNDQLIICWK